MFDKIVHYLDTRITLDRLCYVQKLRVLLYNILNIICS